VAAQRAVLIAGREPSQQERAAGRIVDFFGIPVDISTVQAFASDSTGAFSPSRCSVLISAAAFCAMMQKSPKEFPPALSRAESVFVFDFDGSPESTGLLRWLTGAREAQVVEGARGRQVTVTTDMPAVCGALGGIAAQCSSADSTREFRGVEGAVGSRALLSTSSGTVSFECRLGAVDVFLSACPISLDIDDPVEGRFFDIRRYFSSVVPLLLFLKHAFPGAVGSKRPVGASLIVDDPVLKRRYGYMHFDRVLGAMTRHAFCTTVAFIPWNWRRTNRRTAALFRGNSDRYGLVLHGCDHTANEFATPSVARLNHKAKAALHRAQRHQERTGLRVSPIMVFPQGAFTPDALYVLKCNNFTAAVNTEVNPVGALPPTRVRELWQVAIMQYSSFPVFTRRYAFHGLENFVFDVFLGKPCLIVGHHDVFKDEGRELLTLVDRLNSMAGGLAWGGLDAVIARSYASREDADGTQSIRMFANEMSLGGGAGGGATFRVEKQELDPSAIRRVTCNGREIDWTWTFGFAKFEVEVRQADSVVIRIEHSDRLGESNVNDGTRYRMAVRARRYLSEVRDDYIATNEFLDTCSRNVKRLFR
jgi:hypothetical protein